MYSQPGSQPVCFPICLLISSLLLLVTTAAYARPVAEEKGKDMTAVDWTVIAYQKAKILGGHADPEETLALINQLTGLGHLKDARQLLERSKPFPASYRVKRWAAELKLETAAYFMLEETDPARMEQKAKVRTLLLQLSGEDRHARSDLIHYEQQAEQFAVVKAAQGFCRLLAASDPVNSSKWWAKAGQWSRADNHFKEAVSCYRKAYDSALSQSERRDCLLAKLDALLADGQQATVTQEITAAIAENTHAEILEPLALFCLKIEHPDLAWRIYGRLMLIDPDRREHWQGQIVRWALAAGQPLAAARFFESIATDSLSREQQHLFFSHQLTLLQHAGRLEEALFLAERMIAARPQDVPLLEQAVMLALAAGKLARAEKWNDALLRIKPRDQQLLKRKAEIFMAGSRPNRAVVSIRQLHRLNPDDRKIEQQLAQLEEWTGNPRAALAHWRHLSEVENRLAFDEQIYRLSRMLSDHPTTLAALERIAARRRLTIDELKTSLFLYEIFGRPEKAVELTMPYLQRHPEDYAIWRELAHLQMRSREYRQALETWKEFVDHFGRNQEETFFRAECYWRSGEKRQALEVIDSYPGRLSGLFNLYHADLLVEIGWRYRRPELARESLETLLSFYDESRFYLIERIIYLQKDNGNGYNAIQIALRAAEETRDPRFLALALSIGSTHFNDEQLEAFLRKLQAEQDGLDEIPLYWSIRAQRRYAQGEYRAAEAFYRRALSLDGESLTAREGILWSQLAMGDRRKLAGQLSAWRSLALSNRTLWRVYALSYQFLGQYRLSGIWYERLLESGDPDFQTVSGYADVLEAQGAANRALRLRMWIMRQLQAEALGMIQNKEADSLENIKSFTPLLQRYGSARQGEVWLSALEQLKDESDLSPWIHETAVAWYLDRKCPGPARAWLSKAKEQQIKPPLWQELVFALQENNPRQLEAILADGSGLDSGNKVTLLTKLDRRIEALRLSETGIDPGLADNRISAARMQAAALKQDFPAYLSAGIETAYSDQLDSLKSHISNRAAFNEHPVGVEAALRRLDYSSPVFALKGHAQAIDGESTLHLGDGGQGGSLSFGFNHHRADNVVYGRLEYHRQVDEDLFAQVKLAFHSPPEADSILQVAAVQNRLDTVVGGAFAGSHYYYYLNLWGRSCAARDDADVAKGVGSTAEIGVKQHWGRFEWMAGGQGNFENNFDREFPEYLRQLMPAANTVDDVVAEEATSLLIGGRIGRGAVGEKYPSTGSVRFFASAWFGHTWPQDRATVNLRIGSGVRIFGHDELGLQAYYNQSGGVVGRNDTKGVALQYRYHF